MNWGAHVRAASVARDLLASLPLGTQWGITITDADDLESPSTFNIFVYTLEEENRIRSILSYRMPGKWIRNSGANYQRMDMLLVSIIRQWEDK